MCRSFRTSTNLPAEQKYVSDTLKTRHTVEQRVSYSHFLGAHYLLRDVHHLLPLRLVLLLKEDKHELLVQNGSSADSC